MIDVNYHLCPNTECVVYNGSLNFNVQQERIFGIVLILSFKILYILFRLLISDSVWYLMKCCINYDNE